MIRYLNLIYKAFWDNQEQLRDINKRKLSYGVEKQPTKSIKTSVLQKSKTELRTGELHEQHNLPCKEKYCLHQIQCTRLEHRKRPLCLQDSLTHTCGQVLQILLCRRSQRKTQDTWTTPIQLRTYHWVQRTHAG